MKFNRPGAVAENSSRLFHPEKMRMKFKSNLYFWYVRTRKNNIYRIDLILISFIFLLLMVLPLIFTRENGRIAWASVIKIWQDKVLLVPLFVINHYVLIPGLVLRKKYLSYFSIVLILITSLTIGYYFYDRSPEIQKPAGPVLSNENVNKSPLRPEMNPDRSVNNPPQSVPPFAELLLFSLLIVAVDTGLSFSYHWHLSEREKVRLEKENIEAQLGMLRNQVSPHFFMNTLNNIYALVDADTERAKHAVMKLSKLMRYLLYENKDGRVPLSRELEFIKNYVDLMKLRFAGGVEIQLVLPEGYTDIEIPVLLFISYLENAFKYGASYENKSFIRAVFSVADGYLCFSCSNSRNAFDTHSSGQGIGQKNSRQRLDLLYKNRYSLDINETNQIYNVTLKIPLA